MGAMVCLLAARLVQLSVSAGNGWPHNALRHQWLMPISCHFRDCKALLVTSLTHVSGAIAIVQNLTFTFTSNNTKLVHWPLICGLLHLVQWGGAWAGCGPPINGQCTITLLLYDGPLLCGSNAAIKGWSARRKAKCSVHLFVCLFVCSVEWNACWQRILAARATDVPDVYSLQQSWNLCSRRGLTELRPYTHHIFLSISSTLLEILASLPKWTRTYGCMLQRRRVSYIVCRTTRVTRT